FVDHCRQLPTMGTPEESDNLGHVLSALARNNQRRSPRGPGTVTDWAIRPSPGSTVACLCNVAYTDVMAYRAAVVGGSGYTGAELLRLLAGHPEIEVVHVTADSNAGSKVADLYPSLVSAYPDLVFCPFDPADLDGLDLAF